MSTAFPTLPAQHTRTREDAGFVMLDILLGVVVLGILLLTALSSIGPTRQRAYVASATSDARQLGQRIEAQLTDNKTLADAGLPTSEQVLDASKLSALEVSLTRGMAVSRYTPLSATDFQVCVVHTSSGTIDAYALFDSTSGRVTTSGRGSGPAACAPAGALPSTPTPPTSDPSDPNGTTGPTTGPTPPTGGPSGTPTDDPSASGLGVPANVTARATPGQPRATIRWDAVDGAATYAVYLDGATDPVWTGDATTTDLTGLSTGPHAVTVTARAAGKESAKSTSVPFRIYGDNDFIANAHPVEEQQPDTAWTTVDYSNANASVEAGEPSGSPVSAAYLGMWWRLDANATATYTLSVVQAADGSPLYSYPRLDVWESSATSVGGLPAAPVGTTGTGTSSTVRIAAVEGTTYLVRVSAMSTGSTSKSKYRLRVTPGPANDSLFNAAAITGLQPDTAWLSRDSNNTYADAQAGEPANGDGGMWWTMTAPRTATYTVRVVADSAGSTLYTYPKIFAWKTTTTNVTELGTPVASENNIANVIRFPAVAGEMFKIRASTASSNSTSYRTPFRLQVTPGPTNDSLENAATITMSGPGQTWVSPDVDNTHAGPQAGEPANADGGMWWTFTASTTGNHTFRIIKPTSGANFFTYPGIRVWRTSSTDVTSLGAFTAGNTASGGLNEYFTMALTAGDTYKIRVHTAYSYSTSYRTQYRLQVTN